MSDRNCGVRECTRRYRARGFCSAHLRRLDRYGSPTHKPYHGGAFGPANSAWRGDAAGYTAVHDRLRRSRGAAADFQCVHCDSSADEWSYDHSDPHEKTETIKGYEVAYSVDLGRYRPACRSCHRRTDKGLPLAAQR